MIQNQLLEAVHNWVDISSGDIDSIEYAEIPDGNGWRNLLIQEITDVKFGQASIQGFSIDECQEILEFTCKT